MRTTSYSELRRNLAATLDSVVDDHAPVIITRDRGKPAAVLMSLEDYASLEETRHLLSSPATPPGCWRPRATWTMARGPRAS